jgi:selenide,water dikinase
MVQYDSGVPEDIKTLLFDPQTSGGLLFSVAPEDALRLVQMLRAENVPASHIGEVLVLAKPLLHVV